MRCEWSCNFFTFVRYVVLHIFLQMLVLGKLTDKYVYKTESMNFFEDRYCKKFQDRLMSRKQQFHATNFFKDAVGV